MVVGGAICWGVSDGGRSLSGATACIGVRLGYLRGGLAGVRGVFPSRDFPYGARALERRGYARVGCDWVG